MRPLSCRWAIGGGFQVAVADPDSSWRQRHCPPAPHYAQQQSGGEPEGPRRRRALLQGGPGEALLRSARDRTWQLWCCIFCEYFTLKGYGPSRRPCSVWHQMLSFPFISVRPLCWHIVTHMGLAKKYRVIRAEKLSVAQLMTYIQVRISGIALCNVNGRIQLFTLKIIVMDDKMNATVITSPEMRKSCFIVL